MYFISKSALPCTLFVESIFLKKAIATLTLQHRTQVSSTISHVHMTPMMQTFLFWEQPPFGKEGHQPKRKDKFGRILFIHIFLFLKHFSFAES